MKKLTPATTVATTSPCHRQMGQMVGRAPSERRRMLASYSRTQRSARLLASTASIRRIP